MYDGKIGDDVNSDSENKEMSFLKGAIEKGENAENKKKSIKRKP